jgi:hypothetical protein
MPLIGVPPVGVEPIVGGPTRSIPEVTITSPAGVLTESSVTVAWTFASITSRPQHSFQIKLYTLAGVQVFTSGYLLVEDEAGATTTSGTYDVPFSLATGSYKAEVIATDTMDVSVPTLRNFSVDLPTVADIPALETVGSVYDVALNGVGYIIADRLPDRPVRRTTATLQGPRLSTGETPFNQAIDRYSYATQLDWSGGAGQRVANRSRSIPSRFYRSEGLDPFEEPNRLRLLPDTTSRATNTKNGIYLTAAGTNLIAAHTDDGAVDVYPTGWGSPTSSVLNGGSQECNGLTSDGSHAYLALDDKVMRYTGSWAQFGSTYTSSQMTDIEWTADRLTVGYTNSSGEGCLSTIGPTGSEEQSGGRFQFPGASIRGITAGDGYLWFGVNKGFQGSVYAWNLGSSESRFQAMELPTDQKVESLFAYLGNVMVGARDGLGTVYIYRAIPSAGTLTPSLVMKIEDQLDKHRVDFTARGSLVFFTWSKMNSNYSQPGVGAIDLTTGGYCSWSAPSGTHSGAHSFDVTNFNETLTFSIVTDAGATTLYSENGQTVAEGWLEASTDDSSSALPKVFDEMVLRTEPLNDTDDRVELEASVNGGLTFSSVGTMSGSGSTFVEFICGFGGVSVTTKVTLRSTPGTTGPVVRMVQTKLHPLTISDEVVELPLDLGPNRVGLNGRSLPGGSSPMALLRSLQALTGQRVKFQDVDWPTTRSASVWEVTGVQGSSSGSFSRHKGGRVEHDAVAVVSLRRGQ